MKTLIFFAIVMSLLGPVVAVANSTPARLCREILAPYSQPQGVGERLTDWRYQRENRPRRARSEGTNAIAQSRALVENIRAQLKSGKPFVFQVNHPEELKGLPENLQALIRVRQQEIESLYYHPQNRLDFTHATLKGNRDLWDILPRDQSLARGTVEAQIALGTPAYIAQFHGFLMARTFKLMLESGNSQLVEMARQGQLDLSTGLLVMEQYLAEFGIPAIEIMETEALSSREFRKRIRQGAPVDTGTLQASSDNNFDWHGPFPHLYQMALVAPIFAHYSQEESLQAYFRYFGTVNGSTYFLHAFDGGTNITTTDLAKNPFFVSEKLIDKDFFDKGVSDAKDVEWIREALRVGDSIFLPDADSISTPLHESVQKDLRISHIELPGLFRSSTRYGQKRFEKLYDQPYSNIESLEKIQAAVKEIIAGDLQGDILSLISEIKGMSSVAGFAKRKRYFSQGHWGRKDFIVHESNVMDTIYKLQLHRQDSYEDHWNSFLLSDKYYFHLGLFWIEPQVLPEAFEGAQGVLEKLRIKTAQLVQKMNHSRSPYLQKIAKSLNFLSQSQNLKSQKSFLVEYLNALAALTELDYLTAIANFKTENENWTCFVDFLPADHKTTLNIQGGYSLQYKEETVKLDINFDQETTGYYLAGLNGFGKTVALFIKEPAIVLAQMTGIGPADRMAQKILYPMSILHPPSHGSARENLSTFMAQMKDWFEKVDDMNGKNDIFLLMDEPIFGAASDSRPALIYAMVQQLLDREVSFVFATQDRVLQRRNPFPRVGTLYNDQNFHIQPGISEAKDLSGPALERIGAPEDFMEDYQRFLRLLDSDSE